MSSPSAVRQDGGAHVLNTQQVNEHPWPLSARSVANLGWQTSAAFGSHLRQQSRKQLEKGWAKNHTVAPAWMLKDEGCALWARYLRKIINNFVFFA